MKAKAILIPILLFGMAAIVHSDEGNSVVEHTIQEQGEIVFSESEAIESLLIIEGMGSVGTGFLTEIKGNVFAVTNLHVISGFGDPKNPSVSIKTVQNEKLNLEKVFGADDHDIALIQFSNSDSFRDRALNYKPNIQEFVNSGDKIQVPGNSKGGGVVLWTPGEIKGIGATEIEHTAPTYSGNSGSPIIHLPTKRVIGVHTSAMPNPVQSHLERLLRENPDSAISGDTRHFAFRLDTPRSWYSIDLREFQEQAIQLSKWEEERQLVVGFIMSFLGYEPEINWRVDNRLKSFETDFIETAQQLSTGRRDFAGTDGIYDYYSIYRVIHPEERARLKRKVLGQLHNYIDAADKKKAFEKGRIYPFLRDDYRSEVDGAEWLTKYLQENKNFLSE